MFKNHEALLVLLQAQVLLELHFNLEKVLTLIRLLQH